jgi:hypothetical protein
LNVGSVAFKAMSTKNILCTHVLLMFILFIDYWLKEITIVNHVKLMYAFLFYRWKNNALMLMSNLIISFTTGAIVIGISIVLSFVQVSCHQFITLLLNLDQTNII